VKIRRAVPEDAEAYGQLRSAVLLESEFMLREPGEYQFEAGELARQLEAVSGSGNSVVLLAHGDEDLVGFAAAAGGALSRTRHVAGIVMAVRREYWGRGSGGPCLHKSARGRGTHTCTASNSTWPFPMSGPWRCTRVPDS
jgi:hypothetical protein